MELTKEKIEVLKRFKEVLIQKNKIDEEYRELEETIKGWGEGEFKHNGLKCVVSYIKASEVTEESKNKAIEKAQNLVIGSVSRAASYRLKSELKD